ncbi:hypothetical protein CEXT_447501 [Caerostris extrusa]|uniref:Uncharacterized protein n=1 Tax=Caerostris extrusa TaxID=172846 RepID=A0AAV4UT87_CAEEX|nr:hypothetical protein CEXT_447501 [Caerostris extrusa]
MTSGGERGGHILLPLSIAVPESAIHTGIFCLASFCEVLNQASKEMTLEHISSVNKLQSFEEAKTSSCLENCR